MFEKSLFMITLVISSPTTASEENFHLNNDLWEEIIPLSMKNPFLRRKILPLITLDKMLMMNFFCIRNSPSN